MRYQQPTVGRCWFQPDGLDEAEGAINCLSALYRVARNLSCQALGKNHDISDVHDAIAAAVNHGLNGITVEVVGGDFLAKMPGERCDVGDAHNAILIVVA